jgi:hypothetical protein
LQVGGDWGRTPQSDAAAILLRIRNACLAGVRLLSDRQPERIVVDNHSSGSPSIWLHDDQPTTAWVIVDIGVADWSKLAYQFGHELGHVLANSWTRQAAPKPPSQWLEEAIAEAFSLRGLAFLAASWERSPPFPGNASFANSLRSYRDNIVRNYRRGAAQESGGNINAWFLNNQSALERGDAVNLAPAVMAVVDELEREECTEDLGALNRWRSRTGVYLQEYLTLWQVSCTEIRSAGRLPRHLRMRLTAG